MEHMELKREATAARVRPTRVPTNLTKAILIGADLRGVDLRQVQGLTWAQVRTAVIDYDTRLPLNIRLMWAIERVIERFWLRR